MLSSSVGLNKFVHLSSWHAFKLSAVSWIIFLSLVFENLGNPNRQIKISNTFWNISRHPRSEAIALKAEKALNKGLIHTLIIEGPQKKILWLCLKLTCCISKILNATRDFFHCARFMHLYSLTHYSLII